jgi:hypothetical protein
MTASRLRESDAMANIQRALALLNQLQVEYPRSELQNKFPDSSQANSCNYESSWNVQTQCLREVYPIRNLQKGVPPRTWRTFTAPYWLCNATLSPGMRAFQSEGKSSS